MLSKVKSGKKLTNLHCSRSVREIAIEVTKNCNLDCSFCEVNRTASIKQDISFESVREILKDSSSCGISSVRFTGGEPFLHPDLIGFAAEAKSKGFFVIINTNATLCLSESTLKYLKRYADFILISIQAEDNQLGKYSKNKKRLWEQKLNNIMKISGIGIKNVVLGTVLSRQLLRRWEFYFDLVAKLKIGHWWFFRPTINRLIDDYSLNLKDYLLFIDTIHNSSSDKFKLSINSPLPFCISKDISKNASVLAGGYNSNGYTKLVWDLSGYFKPSYFFDLNLGNNLNRALAHPYMQKLSCLAPIAFCKKCVLFSRCLGGCRFAAQKTFGDLFAPDPLANYKNSLFLKA